MGSKRSHPCGPSRSSGVASTEVRSLGTLGRQTGDFDGRSPGSPDPCARLAFPELAFQWRFRRVLLGDSCEYSYGFVLITRTVFPFDPSRGPSARKLAKEFRSRKRHALRRVRNSRCRKNGVPINAVTTPSFSSLLVGITRTSTSAAVSSTAPASADGTRSFDGRAPVHGRRMCGTTSPTKPIAPLTATQAPTPRSPWRPSASATG